MKELKDISKGNPFRVPENYFDDVSRKIINATSGSGTDIRKQGITRKLSRYFKAAAIVTVLVIFSFTAFLLFRGFDSKPELPEITLNEFMDNYLPDIDVLTLESDVADQGNFLEESGLNKNDLVEYLVLENIEINEIYEKL